MSRRRVAPEEGLRALEQWQEGERGAATLARAVRFSLEELSARAPGSALEVRVPPWGATQCLGGPHHRRGTPPNVVEVDVEAWLGLVVGKVGWGQAVSSGGVNASGVRTDLSPFLPLFHG